MFLCDVFAKRKTQQNKSVDANVQHAALVLQVLTAVRRLTCTYGAQCLRLSTDRDQATVCQSICRLRASTCAACFLLPAAFWGKEALIRSQMPHIITNATHISMRYAA